MGEHSAGAPAAASAAHSGDALLTVRGLRVAHGPVEVVHGIDLDVRAGAVTALLGANGAGKTTTLRALLGHLRPSGGSVLLGGRELAGRRAHRIARDGVALVPEGRRVFASLTVADNLRMGGYGRTAARAWRDPAALTQPLALFPELEPLLERPAGLLSGGEQQMLAMGRALMRRPRLLVLDEPSMGLAPKVVQRIYAALGELRGGGTTILLAEQNARVALALADDAVLLRTGTVAAAGSAAELRDGPLIQEVYLGRG
jgi:branched-chain amino acid transport system ATP-binding protein